jgi:hypothetical protein
MLTALPKFIAPNYVLNLLYSKSDAIVQYTCSNFPSSAYLPPITYYWTVPLILDHSYLVANLTNSKIAEAKALEPLKS